MILQRDILKIKNDITKRGWYYKEPYWNKGWYCKERMILQRAILKIKDDVTKREWYYKEPYWKQRQRDVLQIKGCYQKETHWR